MASQNKPIILIGPMGSGKTTVGTRVAHQMDTAYVDTDDLFEQRHGMISQYFRDHGEEVFRDAEETLIAQTLADRHFGVIALGGGAVIRPVNRENIRAAGYVVFLDVSEAEALQRIGDGSDRPVLAGDPEGNWSRIRRQRLQYFEQTAHQSVDTSNLDVDVVANKIIQGYHHYFQGKQPRND